MTTELQSTPASDRSSVVSRSPASLEALEWDASLLINDSFGR